VEVGQGGGTVEGDGGVVVVFEVELAAAVDAVRV
jgi:hypothetical protein